MRCGDRIYGCRGSRCSLSGRWEGDHGESILSNARRGWIQGRTYEGCATNVDYSVEAIFAEHMIYDIL